jgi:3-methyl-2-oxobutanoate hydroxymethyltransferase
LGLFEWTPKFVRRYADLKSEVTRAVSAYAEDVRSRRFPAAAETYSLRGGQKPTRIARGGERG